MGDQYLGIQSKGRFAPDRSCQVISSRIGVQCWGVGRRKEAKFVVPIESLAQTGHVT